MIKKIASAVIVCFLIFAIIDQVKDILIFLFGVGFLYQLNSYYRRKQMQVLPMTILIE